MAIDPGGYRRLSCSMTLLLLLLKGCNVYWTKIQVYSALSRNQFSDSDKKSTGSPSQPSEFQLN